VYPEEISMTDFPEQTDPTTAADSAEPRAIDGDPVVNGNPGDADSVEAAPAADDAGDVTPADAVDEESGDEPAAAVSHDALAHVGNGVYQSAGGGFTGAADRVNERLHEMAGRAGEAIAQATDDAGERISGATQAAVTRIRNNASLPASRGTTTIANEVVEKIAGIAARDVPGVYDLGGDTVRLLSSVREKLHLGEESRAQGIAVKLNGNEADLSITIVLEYGFVVSSVTDTVREKTISAVETLLGLDVTNVDILVDDIHVDDDRPIGDDATRAAGYSSGTQGITVGG
jgi:uncharacterized alkaline shock family protein YloU/uncharacterized protein YjbJ (UPF0337 family)